jgi:hypothetical protein
MGTYAHTGYLSDKLGPLDKPHKWYDKGSAITLRFQAPVTTVESETLL